MRRVLRMALGTLLCLVVISISSLCEAQDAGELVDRFKKSTDLQQAELVNEYMYKQLSAKGAVANVEEHDTFNLGLDKSARYYKVVTEVQDSPLNNPYVVSFFYKTQDEVKGIEKGQPIQKTGAVLKILDERLWVSVWIYVGDVTEEERIMFGEPGALPPPPVQYPLNQ